MPNMTINLNKILIFHHTIKWTTPGLKTNSTRKTKLHGITKPSNKLEESVKDNQHTVTVIQYTHGIGKERQHIPTLIKVLQATLAGKTGFIDQNTKLSI